MARRRLVLLAYDVTAPRRLAAALKIATAFSHGGQKSAHEAWVSAREAADLRRRIDAALHPAEDRWALFDLGPRPVTRGLGRAVPPQDKPVLFFGWGEDRR